MRFLVKKYSLSQINNISGSPSRIARIAVLDHNVWVPLLLLSSSNGFSQIFKFLRKIMLFTPQYFFLISFLIFISFLHSKNSACRPCKWVSNPFLMSFITLSMCSLFLHHKEIIFLLDLLKVRFEWRDTGRMTHVAGQIVDVSSHWRWTRPAVVEVLVDAREVAFEELLKEEGK